MASKHLTLAHALGILAAPFQAAIAAASTLEVFPGRNRYENARADRMTAVATRIDPAFASPYRKAALTTREQIADSTRQPV